MIFVGEKRRLIYSTATMPRARKNLKLSPSLTPPTPRTSLLSPPAANDFPLIFNED